MKIYLVDVHNAIEMAHYETFFYQNIKQGNIAVYDRSLDSLEELGSVLGWIHEDINRDPFAVRKALVIFLLSRRLSSQREAQDFEIYAKMYINELVEKHLDDSFRYLCFYMDDAGRDHIDDRLYREIDEVNAQFSSDEPALQGTFLPYSPEKGDPKAFVAQRIGHLPDTVAAAFYRRMLAELEQNSLEGDDSRLSADAWYRSMFLRHCQETVSSVKVFRTAFFTDKIHQKLETSLKIVKYICRFADTFDENAEFDVQLAGFLNQEHFKSFSVDMEEAAQTVSTYMERLRSWTAPEYIPPRDKPETFQYIPGNHSQEFSDKIDKVSTKDLDSALDPKDDDLSEFDLQAKVFASMDKLIQDVRKILHDFCDERVAEMNRFFQKSVPTELDRAAGVSLTDEELEKERSSANEMDQYAADALPGYSAELKLRQELELIGRRIRRIGKYLNAMKLRAFLFTLVFGILSVGGFYCALQYSVFDKEDTWKVFGIYTVVCAVLFTGAYAAVRVRYRRQVNDLLKDAKKLVDDYLQSFKSRAEEFEKNLNAAMRYYCDVDADNKETAERQQHTDFERRKQWHRQKIVTLLHNLEFFDGFIRNADRVQEHGVPEIKLTDDAVHNDFYQMRIFR